MSPPVPDEPRPDEPRPDGPLPDGPLPDEPQGLDEPSAEGVHPVGQPSEEERSPAAEAFSRTASVLGRAASAIARAAAAVTSAVTSDDHDDPVPASGTVSTPDTVSIPDTGSTSGSGRDTGAGQSAPSLSAAVVDVVAAGFGTASRSSLTRLLDRLGVEQEADAAELSAFGEGLRAVAGLLGHEPGLRRALTEPARDGVDRTRLAHVVLDGRVAAPVAALVGDAAGDRWSAPRDLVDGLDVAATAAEVAAARQTGDLDSLEDDIFRFERIVDGNPDLREALSDRRAPASSRAALVHGLLDGKTSGAAIRLVSAAVADLRGRSLETALAEISDLVAALQDRVVAVVRVAAPSHAGAAHLARGAALEGGRPRRATERHRRPDRGRRLSRRDRRHRHRRLGRRPARRRPPPTGRIARRRCPAVTPTPSTSARSAAGHATSQHSHTRGASVPHDGDRT